MTDKHNIDSLKNSNDIYTYWFKLIWEAPNYPESEAEENIIESKRKSRKLNCNYSKYVLIGRKQN